MATYTIYKSPEGEVQIKAIYDRYLARLDLPYEERTVETRFGLTHLLVFGPEDGPPLLSLHGGNAVNPHSLLNLRPLLLQNCYRVYAPDTIGHPGYSEPARLSTKSNDYALWGVDILDALGLERAPVVAQSFGGGILLKMATHAPERIERAAFIVPAGIVSPPKWPMISQVVWPMLRYLLFATAENLRRSVAWMTTESADEDLLAMLGAVFTHLKIEADMFGPTPQEDLTSFTAPVLVMAAKDDLLFPGQQVIQRAEVLFPNLVEAELLPGKHLPSTEIIAWCNERIVSFMQATGEEQPAQYSRLDLKGPRTA